MTGRLSYYLDYQSLIDLMYRAWVLILSIGMLLPVRWFSHQWFRPKAIALPATFALVACGEIVLGNPILTPPGPYCGGESIEISFQGTNLPDGEDIQIFMGDQSAYNPFNGGGSYIGSIPVEYNCSTCPQLLGIMSDPCTGGTDEQDNEFLAFSSGCGFNVSDLLVDYDINNNSFGIANADVCSSCPCNFITPDANLIAQLQASTNCPNLIIPAESSSTIPPGAVVIVFTDAWTPSVPYNFDDLCSKGLEIFILQSSCERTQGAFTNNPTSERTYSIEVGSCSSQITYNNDPSYPAVSTTTESVFRSEERSVGKDRES